ncbi:hypothetical protein PHYSODRAFT_336109 [Phytophthora sojae]|uniref:Ankyrin repeat protein n=1 Tax=Phytophthora sojae (strain P6497) TaxID=1094619 RepID=G4ZW08_PHYSP|nr:hypothetical protein PHYSODRAFT_336109 [Phytophthora sojae]EGZ11588.1 hypothetical protein PHYSODRAFT_336109 [Phytophthora sojae]|eukprot:XP_009531921.1 hypothetical protein PHYSODRAFT_336109 [Phytophthora sojae]
MSSLELVQWLFERFPDCGSTGVQSPLQWKSDMENGTRLGAAGEDVAGFTGEGSMQLAQLQQDTEVFKWMYRETADALRDDYAAVSAAVAAGDVALAQWLVDTADVEPNHPAEPQGAAAGGHVDPLQWLHDRGKYLQMMLSWEVRVSAKPRTTWLHENRPEGCTTDAIDGAASWGHLDVVKWLHEHTNEGCTAEAMNGAAEGGHLEVVNWLHENRTEGCTSAAMDNAARGGYLNIVKWLHANRTEGCTSAAMDGAAGCGAMDVVKWLRHNSKEGCTTSAMSKAAQSGYRRVLRWLYENRMEARDVVDATENASWAGQFEAVLMLELISNPDLAILVLDDHDSAVWTNEHYSDVLLVLLPRGEDDDDGSDDNRGSLPADALNQHSLLDMASPSAPTPPLLAVALLFRSKPQFAGIDHVIHAVSTFADSSVELPLASASRFGSVALLERVWNSSVDLEPGGRSLWSVRRLLRDYPLYNKWQFTLSLVGAIKANSVEVVRWLFERYPDYGVRRKVVYEAASAGALEILRFFRDNGTIVNFADEEDLPGQEWDQETENWERGRWVYWGNEDAERAAAAGHVDVVRYIYETAENEDRSDYGSMEGAVAAGDLELLRWLQDHLGMEPEGYTVPIRAAAGGHLEALQYLKERGYCRREEAGVLVKAAEAGHLHVVRWIIEEDWNDEAMLTDGGSDDEDWYSNRMFHAPKVRRTYHTSLGGEASLAIHAAAINGHLEVAKYLYARTDKPLNPRDEDIENRRLADRKATLERPLGQRNNAHKVSGETMYLAAQRGYFDVVQWLYTEFNADPTINLFWTSGHHMEQLFDSTVDAAAASGRVEIVQYLLQADSATQDSANAEQKPKRRCLHRFRDFARDILEQGNYKLELEPTRPSCTTDVMDLAARNGHLEMVKWLHYNRSEGCTTKAMDEAARGGHLEVVKWLHEHRTEGCTVGAMDSAAGGGHLEVVKWLHENCTEGCSRDAMTLAAESGHLRVLRWLHENRTGGFTTGATVSPAAVGNFEPALILHGIAQNGLASRVDRMEEDASKAWVAEQYHEVVRVALKED